MIYRRIIPVLPGETKEEKRKLINICDAIMGSGKSSAAITYINEHPGEHFIYLAPYLEEARRIKDACPGARFVEPQPFRSSNIKSKTEHSYELLQNGINVVSTHEALMRYTPDMLKVLDTYKYTVIIDESVSILSKVNNSMHGGTVITSTDIQILNDAGLIRDTGGGEYVRTEKECGKCLYTPLLKMIEARSLIQIGNGNGGWCWLFHPDVFRYSKDVFVLTYMFPGSEMEQFLKINQLEYRHIGIARDEDGTYRFSEHMDYVPSYVADLPDMIHVCDTRRMNKIGDDKFSLSESWFKHERNKDLITQLKKNEQNFFQHYAKDTVDGKRMVGTFKDNWDLVKGGGFGRKDKNQVMFNRRAENRWGDYTALSYPVNIFLNPNVAKFYEQRGGHLDEDAYALSTMVQWIWRSAIRNGREIYVYVPSLRMRGMLLDWIDDVSKTYKGGDTWDDTNALSAS